MVPPEERSIRGPSHRLIGKPTLIKADTKKDRIKAALAERIHRGEFGAGDKLPSFREIAREFGVSPLTSSIAVSELRAAGLVFIRQGVGAFVADSTPEPEKKTVIGLTFPDSAATYLDDVGTTHPTVVQFIGGLHEHFTSPSFTVEPLMYQPGEMLAPSCPVRQMVEANEIGGLAIDGPLTAEESRRLSAHGIPLVLLDPVDTYLQLAAVRVNALYGYRLLLQHLRNLGHRNILFVDYRSDWTLTSSGENRYIDAARAEGYPDFGEEQVILIEDLGLSVTRVDYPASIRRALDRGPSALLVRDEVIANRVFWEATRRGIRIPEDLSLVSMVDMAPHTHPIPLSTLNTSRMLRECARMAGELLERGLRGEDIRGRRIELTPTLLPGSTSAPCEESNKTQTKV